MSITLNNSDFQCLQDQLVDLKTKNYELAEKNRRSQADFDAAKAKIYSLQLKLEEQERDFQVTSTTLRREIEAATKNQSGCSNDESDNGNGNKDDDYKTKYKKLLHKAKELQQRYEKSVGVIQQMDDKIKMLTGRTSKLEEDNKRLRQEFEDKQQKIVTIEQEYSSELNSAIEEYRSTERSECMKHVEELDIIKEERDSLKAEIEQLKDEAKKFNSKIESLEEERRIQEKKGSQMIKELKRQLTSEKNRNETLQKRLETLLTEATNGPSLSSSSDLENKTRMSSSSNGNSRGSRGASGSGGNNNTHCDDNSVSSWSLVARGKTSTPSICSIESEDRETVQLPSINNNCDTTSQISQQYSPSLKSTSRLDVNYNQNSSSPGKQRHSSSTSLSQNSIGIDSDLSRTADNAFGLKFEDQAALMERVTRLQHDKWTLEEKLSYMEQANAALTQDLADKSQIVRQYFMDQAMKSANNNHLMSHNSHSQSEATSVIYGSGTSGNSNLSRRISFPNNFNQLLTDKPSLKKMVDFLKERGQVSSIMGGGESETITREATKKMQIMLEETLIKCLKLQENLDLVTSELNKSKS